MKDFFGVILIICGIAVGLYAGVYLMFIGGIIQIVQSISPEIIASGIAWGVVRIMFAGLTGAFSAVCFIFPGVAILKSR